MQGKTDYQEKDKIKSSRGFRENKVNKNYVDQSLGFLFSQLFLSSHPCKVKTVIHCAFQKHVNSEV